MRFCYKIHQVIFLWIWLLLFSQVIFAQNIEDFPAKSRHSHNMVGTKRDPATNLSTEREKLDIYSKLRDRRCTTMTLDKCNCPDAKEMKAYIDALIEMGVNKEEIFYKVAKKFSLNTILDKGIKTEVEKRLIEEAGQNRPQIFLESTSFDFGRVSKKQSKISKIFKLSNTGNSPLIIKNIKTSCPCATVSLKVNKKKTPYFGTEGAPKDWQVEIKPGKTGELELLIDLGSQHVKTGKLIREASIFSNDPVYPEVEARVEAEVNE